MNELYKKQYIEGEKGQSHPSYNLNSFRGNSNHKAEKEVKILSPRIVLQSVEKADADAKSKQGQIKPRLLTGRLPSAFDVKYRRTGSDLSGHENDSPRKVIVNGQPSLNNNLNPNNFVMNICVTEEDENISTHDKVERYKYLRKQNSTRIENKIHSGLFLSDSDSNNDKVKILQNKNICKDENKEIPNILKPIIVKQNPVNRLKSASPGVKEKVVVHNNFININNMNNHAPSYGSNSNANSDSKSTGNCSQGSSQYNHPLSNRNSISRTHDSFFPKIKSSFEMHDDEPPSEVNKKFNSNNVIMNVMSPGKKSNELSTSNSCGNIKLEDGISLSLINNNGNKRIKKFFHLPNFEIYSIREIPVCSKFFISNIRDKLTYWCSKVGESNRFVKVLNEYVNCPEGYVSLVTEYMQGYSLQDILDAVGSLNESVLCKMAIQIVQCLHEYNEKFSEDFGNFATGDILFDKVGNLKLLPNILININKNRTASNSNCISQSTSSPKLTWPSANQYFYLGYILLTCATAGLKFDSLEKILNNYQNFSTNGKCCLYHLLISIEQKSSQLSGKYSKLKISNFINNKIYSENFINFLCFALSFEKVSFSNAASKMANHPWIKISNYIHLNNNTNRVRVSMKEIIKLARELKGFSHRTISQHDKKLANFLNNFDIILSNNRGIKQDELINLLNMKKSATKELCIELGVNIRDLVSKLQDKIQQDYI